MPIVSELYGFKIGESTDKLPGNLVGHCPHANRRCDGGGNRNMAAVSLQADPGLRARFDMSKIDDGVVACGICTVGLSGSDWIICPRRLLSFSKNSGWGKRQNNLICTLLSLHNISSPAIIGIWSELSISQKFSNERFNYRLDYLVREKLPNGWGAPLIVEVMTCSTSGGNKAKGTDIATAFRKALLSNGTVPIASPGVNVRQVWARMASQLIVKSELGTHWGGKTIWVVQDKLADYIDAQTGLDLKSFESDTLDEVNILAVSSNFEKFTLYAGPISGGTSQVKGFLDILRAPKLPSVSKLDLIKEKHFLGEFSLAD